MAEKKDEKRTPEMFSIRLDERQRKLIDEAADATRCSSAKFVRDAAVTRAVNVLNASGARETQLRELARKLVGHCFHPEAVVRDEEAFVKSDLWDVTHEMTLKAEALRMHYEEAEANGETVWCNRMADGAGSALREAMENAGTEFVRLFLEEWDGWGKQGLEYKSTVKLSDVLD